MTFHRQDRNVCVNLATYSPRKRIGPEEARGELFMSCITGNKYQTILSSQCLQFLTGLRVFANNSGFQHTLPRRSMPSYGASNGDDEA